MCSSLWLFMGSFSSVLSMASLISQGIQFRTQVGLHIGQCAKVSERCPSMNLIFVHLNGVHFNGVVLLIAIWQFRVCSELQKKAHLHAAPDTFVCWSSSKEPALRRLLFRGFRLSGTISRLKIPTDYSPIIGTLGCRSLYRDFR